MSATSEICEVKFCRQRADCTYAAGAKPHRVCRKHWEKHCDGTINLKNEEVFA